MNKPLFVLGAALMWCFGSSAMADVGFAQFDIQSEPDGSIPVALWYPTDATTTQIRRGPFVFRGAENAAPQLGAHPLVVLSHGSGSGQLTHMNLAVHLADAGFVVAAPTHVSDNFQDGSGSGSPEVIQRRAATISEVIDRIPAPNPLALEIDGERIAAIGFSAGGATVLALAGLRPSLSEAVNHCAAYNDPSCRFVDTDDRRFDDSTPMSDLGDSRVRSIVALAPVTAYFNDAELAKLSVPAFVFAPGLDAELSPTANASRLRDLVPRDLTFNEEPEAGHYAILPVFPESTWGEIPSALRTDLEGFDRAAFHQRLLERIAAFLYASLNREK